MGVLCVKPTFNIHQLLIIWLLLSVYFGSWNMLITMFSAHFYRGELTGHCKAIKIRLDLNCMDHLRGRQSGHCRKVAICRSSTAM